MSLGDFSVVNHKSSEALTPASLFCLWHYYFSSQLLKKKKKPGVNGVRDARARKRAPTDEGDRDKVTEEKSSLRSSNFNLSTI